MTNRILMVLTAAVLTFSPIDVEAQGVDGAPARGVCAPDNPLAREEVRSVLTDPGLTEARDRAGLVGFDPASVTLLEGPADAQTCAQLQRRIPRVFTIHGPDAPWVATYFRAGDRFVITVISNPNSRRDVDLLAWGQTIILDPEFRILESIFN
ncbi:MAG: hypothetical protein RQ745_01015 [Longimicrobiales bacterium]|nr:hypothetical protein [Longimicrobiales bacterium]